jgi:hypothetical protein
MTVTRYAFVFFVLAVAAPAAASTDVTARRPIRSTITLDYDFLTGRFTGQVKSANPKCKKNRPVTVRTTIGQILAKVRTNRRGSFSVRSVYRDFRYGTEPLEYTGNVPSGHVEIVSCAPARSRPHRVFDDLGCRSTTSQDSKRPDEDLLAVGCPVQIAKIGEIAEAPITDFQNPGFAVAPPGAQGTRQIPGTQLDPNWVEYTPSPVLEPNWVFFNNLKGLPKGSIVKAVYITADGRAEYSELALK